MLEQVSIVQQKGLQTRKIPMYISRFETNYSRNENMFFVLLNGTQGGKQFITETYTDEASRDPMGYFIKLGHRDNQQFCVVHYFLLHGKK